MATTPPHPDADELADLLPSWRLSLRAARKSASTQEGYLRGMTQFLAWCEERSVETPMHRTALEGWLASLVERDFQPYTMRARLTAVRQFTAWWLTLDETPDVDPFTHVKPPSLTEKQVNPLTEDELRAMLATCRSRPGELPERRFLNTRDEAIIRIMMETGLRAAEVVGLDLAHARHHADPPYLEVARSKTKTTRRPPISDAAALALDKYVRARRKIAAADETALFVSARSKARLRYSGLYAALEDRAEQASVPNFHPHRMRHTAAHRWLSAGGSEDGLMTVAGWKSNAMLHRYTKARAEERAMQESRRLNLGDI